MSHRARRGFEPTGRALYHRGVPENPATDVHAKLAKPLRSQVKQLLGHVGKDESKTVQLITTLNELNALLLAGHQIHDAAADVQDAMSRAAKQLASHGPIGPYTPLDEAAQYVTAVAHLTVVQRALGLPQDAGSSAQQVMDWRADLPGSVDDLVPAATATWLLLARAEAFLAIGEAANANAYGDAAAAHARRLHDDDVFWPVALDAHTTVADARWAAGLGDQAIDQGRAAVGLWTRRTEGARAMGKQVPPAYLERIVWSLPGLFENVAGRLAGLGDVDSAGALRAECVAVLEALPHKAGSAVADRLDVARQHVEDAAIVPPAAGGVSWVPLAGTAGFFEDAAGVEADGAAHAEQQRLAAEKAAWEQERLETIARGEREQAERLAAAETQRIATEQAEAERFAAEQNAADEAARMTALQAERDRESERRRIMAEYAARAEAQRVEAERIEARRLETERLEAERLEAERLETKRLETKRLAAERGEADKGEAERADFKDVPGSEPAPHQESVTATAGPAHDSLTPQAQPSGPELTALVTAREALATARAFNDRRGARDALTLIVEALRPLEASDPGTHRPQLIAALEELASARRWTGDLWGARGAVKEAKDLANRR